MAQHNAVRCNDCGWSGGDGEAEFQTDPAEVLHDDPGGIVVVPAGNCPECGAFVYYDRDMAAWNTSEAAPDLLAACQSALHWFQAAPDAALEVVDAMVKEPMPVVKLEHAIAKAGAFKRAP